MAGDKTNWGAILAGAAVVTGIVAACIFVPEKPLDMVHNAVFKVGEWITKAVSGIAESIVTFAKSGGPVGASVVLGGAALAGGWAGKRIDEVVKSTQELGDSIKGR